MIHKLQDNFIGIGEVKDFQFNKVEETEKGYIFSVTSGDKEHYEVFSKKLSAVCLDFAKRKYSETEFKEVYPKSKDFGKTAWTKTSLPDAMRKLTEIEEYESNN